MDNTFTLFNDDYNKKVHEEWNKFIKKLTVSTDIVRPETLEFWQECMARGIDPYKNVEPRYLPEDTLARLLEENKLMCDVALPFMMKIYENIPGPSSFISLYNKDCISLTGIQSSNDYDDYLNEHGYRSGMIPESIYADTAEVSMCMKYKKPAWCCGEENYLAASKDWTCSAAPILDVDGNLLGILSMSVLIKDAHWHTMGMVISAAKAIENEMLTHAAHEEAKNIANQLTATIESVPQGMIVVDQAGKICHANSYTKKNIIFNQRRYSRPQYRRSSS